MKKYIKWIIGIIVFLVLFQLVRNQMSQVMVKNLQNHECIHLKEMKGLGINGIVII
jgi:hypothetical protein